MKVTQALNFPKDKGKRACMKTEISV